MTRTIRTLSSADVPRADPLLAAAYGRPEAWGKELARYLDFGPEGWFGLWEDGRLAGVGGAIAYGPFGWVGLMGVLPELQRRGIAADLLRRVLDWLEAVGNPVAVLDASAAGQRLYERFGFRDSGGTALYRRDPRPADVDLEVSQPAPVQDPEDSRVEIATEAHLPDIAAWDRPLFGADRSALLAAYLRDLPGRLLVARSVDGAIEGYLLAQGARLGPWVAATPGAAQALLSVALRLPFEGPITVLAPTPNEDAGPLLDLHGFTPERSLRHMVLGGDDPQPGRDRIYGQASFAAG